jgi:hypothetical protein
MNKFHEHIIKDFIKHYCKFNFEYNPIGKDYYEVAMYIDQYNDIDDPWTFNVDDYRQDIRRNIFHKIRDKEVSPGSSMFYESMNKILSDYGLYEEELELVYKLITHRLIEMLEEYNSRIE